MTRAVAIGRRPVATEAEPRGPYLLLLALLISACALYGFHLGIKTLSTSEAYSELAARQPTLSAVVQSALQFDPGKPPLYHLGLHWFCALAGRSEISLRAFSVIWGLVDLGVLFALGEQFFGVETALAAVTIWA